MMFVMIRQNQDIKKIEKFEFEDIEIDEMTLRSLILDEIMFFNPEWKKQLKQQYKAKANQLKKLHKENNTTK